ncbi:quinoprotein dehydrogenase-associated SoxYZ-like carrier [Sphingosinicellaceae bacterium]|nr:quinoprotein dehydrogenase-associated SoxYZ-like carrier [Sphingosinicellaceae bacterium]
MKHRIAIALAIGLTSPLAAAVIDDAAGREARWNDISQTIFAGKPLTPTSDVVVLDAPARAVDPAAVPMVLTMPGPDKVAAVSLVIDDNPSPYAAHIAFGPAALTRSIGLRVRVNAYTNVHAVAQTADGRLFETVKFVKASGGCSAPVGGSEEEALRGMGTMSLLFAGKGAGAPNATAATLTIRHPNFSGMQMDQLTRQYTLARYVQKIVVTQGGRNIFTLDGDISLATNPTIDFAFTAAGKAPVEVVASDNQGGHWEQSFALPGA